MIENHVCPLWLGLGCSDLSATLFGRCHWKEWLEWVTRRGCDASWPSSVLLCFLQLWTWQDWRRQRQREVRCCLHPPEAWAEILFSWEWRACFSGLQTWTGVWAAVFLAVEMSKHGTSYPVPQSCREIMDAFPPLIISCFTTSLSPSSSPSSSVHLMSSFSMNNSK